MRKITNKHLVFYLFIICYAAYFISYLGRLNYSAAITQFLEADILSKTEAGLINTAFFICYATGQIINGYLGDRISAKRMLMCGLIFSSICNFIMGFCTSFIPMALLWASNGYFQSMLWPPIMRIFTDMFKKETAVKCFTNFSSTAAVGTLASYFISALLLQSFSWEYIFYIPSLLMIGVAIIFFMSFNKIEQHRTQSGEVEIDPQTDATPTKNMSIPLITIFCSPLILIILLPTLIHGVLKDGLTAWIPTFISETFNASSVTALLVSMILPIINILGAYLVTYFRRWVKEELKLATHFFIATFGSLLCLTIFGPHSLLLSLICLSICSCSMFAVNFIFITLIPIKYAKYGCSSTISGFLNAIGYLGASISSVGIGYLAGHYGWNVVLVSFIIFSTLSTIICAFSFVVKQLSPINQLANRNYALRLSFGKSNPH